MNSQYSSSVQKPITRSTPARLYQERSKRTISPARAQLRDIALEVPLRPLALVRRAEGHDRRAARVQRLDDALHGPAFAGGVASLEDQTIRSPTCLIQCCSFTSSSCRPASSRS
jgi:hypothetical protein